MHMRAVVRLMWAVVFVEAGWDRVGLWLDYFQSFYIVYSRHFEIVTSQIFLRFTGCIHYSLGCEKKGLLVLIYYL